MTNEPNTRSPEVPAYLARYASDVDRWAADALSSQLARPHIVR